MRSCEIVPALLLVLSCCFAETLAASALDRELFAVADALSADHDNLQAPPSNSLCGEQVQMETGFLNGLYYIFYESSSARVGVGADLKIPVILWLSGGPGCSGLVGGLFELGPCIFDDEADRVSFNPYAWTSLAHVIFLDQPRGTGFSDPDNDSSWTHAESTQYMASFLVQFFENHPELAARDFYIFGESYGGHFVPNLAQRLLSTDPERWKPVMKGVGIGNGLVSPQAVVDTYVDFASTNSYVGDLLGENEDLLRQRAAQFALAIQECESATNDRTRRRSLRTNSAKDCEDAVDYYDSFLGIADAAVASAGRNVYDVRRLCHVDDRIGLCYRFSRLEDFVNQPKVLAYFGASRRRWTLCNDKTYANLRRVDFIEESESGVAYLLEQGVRVLVYGGDADSVVNWESQDVWTRRLKWSRQKEFNAAPVESFRVSAKPVGLVRSAHGLSFMKVFEAGHVRPGTSYLSLLLRSCGSHTHSHSHDCMCLSWICVDGSSRPTACGARNGAPVPSRRRGELHVHVGRTETKAFG